MRYLSLFSGIGGLEHEQIEPVLFCERDALCRQILGVRHPAVPLFSDVTELLLPPPSDIVVGGWPCQDISVAGKLQGLAGSRSSLFFEMLRVAQVSGAHTIVGENVPNLLSINAGRDFEVVLEALVKADYRFIAWRVLNARAFGLPQERRRLFIVASKQPEHSWALHASLPATVSEENHSNAYGFYWTAGKRSLCFSHGYVPTLKIGAADEKGRAPVAVFIDGHIRKLSTFEFLRLQGFRDLSVSGIPDSALLRMAGNAVPLPMGRFVMKSVFELARPSGIRSGFGVVQDSGFYDNGIIWMVNHKAVPLASDLHAYLDPVGADLSPQACAGLIVRAVRAGQKMPLELYEVLGTNSDDRSRPLHPSRSNSFEALSELSDRLDVYRASLTSLSDNR